MTRESPARATSDKAEVTRDAFLGGQILLDQPRVGYRSAIDGVCLAAALPPVPPDGLILDIGCGTGVVSLCARRRLGAGRVIGLDLDPDAVALARSNAAVNALQDAVAFTTGDLRAWQPPALAAVVASNPPYYEEGTVVPPPQAEKAQAFVLKGLSIADWCARCLTFLAPKGRFCFVLPAGALEPVMGRLSQESGGGVGDLRLFPLWPFAGRPAKRVLLAGRKGVRGPLKLLPGLVLHTAASRYSPEATQVLREGAGLQVFD